MPAARRSPPSPNSAIEIEPWAQAAHQAGVKLFGDVGWDPSGEWAPVRLENLQYFHAFLPNQREAMAFTGQGQPVVGAVCPGGPGAGGRGDTGAQGAMAVDSETGEEEWVPVLAGHRLRSDRRRGLLRRGLHRGQPGGWPLGDRLRFANLCAALAVQEVGGSLAAPGWGDIADWWKRANARPERQGSQWLRRFGFLADIVRDVPLEAQRRAGATIAHLSDA